MQHKFVDSIPVDVEDNVLYISIPFCTAIHKCVCGCGKEVVTPLSPTNWQLTFDGKTVSLYPSIGNWNFECQSHYFITKGEIEFARKWSDEEVEKGRREDARRKRKYYVPQNRMLEKKFRRKLKFVIGLKKKEMNIFEVLKKSGMDKWLWQQEGVIDHAKERKLPGTQPIRAVIAVTVHFFKNTNNEYFDQLVKLTRDGRLNRELDLQFGEVQIQETDTRYRTPRIVNDTRTIQLHETFLSYQWCIAYAIYTLFVETIDYPKINAEHGKIVKPISPDKIEKAKEVFDYGRFLIKAFDHWDKDQLPNPERYSAADRTYIEQTNVLFTEGIKFILCHEVAHAKKHLDDLPDQDCASCFQEMEYDADNEAINNILRGANGNKFILELGVVIGILSMIFFRSITIGTKHPNVEDRLTNALIRMKVKEDSVAWAMACVGLELWDEQFDLGFDWTAKANFSYKDLYFSIVEQIKSRQAGN